MWVNEGMFVLNGGSGFVPKPKMMLAGASKWNKYLQKIWNYNVKVKKLKNYKFIVKKVIDAWRPASKKSLADKISKTLPSIYVKVSVYNPTGVKSYQTEVVENNGLNPVFDEEFPFEVSAPEVTCLLFVVYNKNESDSFVGYYSIPIGAARVGYRRIPLKDATVCTLTNFSSSPLPISFYSKYVRAMFFQIPLCLFTCQRS